MYEVITYNPIRDYGGWGIRFGKGVKVYNVSGNQGLHLYLRSGKRILLGTQEPVAVKEFLSNGKWIPEVTVTNALS